MASNRFGAIKSTEDPLLESEGEEDGARAWGIYLGW